MRCSYSNVRNALNPLFYTETLQLNCLRVQCYVPKTSMYCIKHDSYVKNVWTVCTKWLPVYNCQWLNVHRKKFLGIDVLAVGIISTGNIVLFSLFDIKLSPQFLPCILDNLLQKEFRSISQDISGKFMWKKSRRVLIGIWKIIWFISGQSLLMSAFYYWEYYG